MREFLLEIDKYLEGNMTDVEKTSFEDEISHNTSLAEELKLQKDMRAMLSEDEWVDSDISILETESAKKMKSFLESEEATRLKHKIAEVVVENRKEKNRNSSFFKFAIAASIAVIMFVSVFNFNSSIDELYPDYINTDELPSLVTRGDKNTDLLTKGELLFEEKKYNEAIKVFKEYQDSSESINAINYIYTGISFIEVKNYKEALSQFELLERSETLHSKKHYWYKAMIHLKNSDEKELINILNIILKDPKNYKYSEALKLLEAIK